METAKQASYVNSRETHDMHVLEEWRPSGDCLEETVTCQLLIDSEQEPTCTVTSLFDASTHQQAKTTTCLANMQALDYQQQKTWSTF